MSAPSRKRTRRSGPPSSRTRTQRFRVLDARGWFKADAYADELEGSLAVLTNLMGSQLHDDFYEIFVNPMLDGRTIKPVELKNTTFQELSKKTKSRADLAKKNPAEIDLSPNVIYLFFPNDSVHFVVSYYDPATGREHFWNSYYEGIQVPNTNNFCQTFALMKAVHVAVCGEGACPATEAAAPDIVRHVAAQFDQFRIVRKNELHMGEVNQKYVDNVIVAKNTACDILQSLYEYKYPKFKKHLKDAFQETDDDGNSKPWADIFAEVFQPGVNFDHFYRHFPEFLEHCRGITEEQIRGSTYFAAIYNNDTA